MPPNNNSRPPSSSSTTSSYPSTNGVDYHGYPSSHRDVKDEKELEK